MVDFGVDRVTLAEIARRAGVSRPTVYRRWPDTPSIMSALLTSHITGVMREAPLDGDDREALVKQIVAVADRLRRDELVMSVLHSQLARIYITERLGTSQQILIDALAARLDVAQRIGQRPRRRPASDGDHGVADRAVDHPVRATSSGRSLTPTRWPPSSPTR